jgi:hypothetical protein
MTSRGPRPVAGGRAPGSRGPALVATVAAAWLLTRGFVLWLYLGHESWVSADADYFARSIAAVPGTGLAATLVEYPVPGVVVMAFPWLLVDLLGVPQAYAEAVLVLSLLADAGFLVLLGCRGDSRRRAASLTVWVLAVPLLGATAYARFDLVPGLLAATALLLVGSNPRLAAVAGAVATGLKLWPALVLPALAAVTAFMVTSKVLSPQYLLWLLPLAAAGTALTASPALRTWTAVLLVATAATHVVFPLLYEHLWVRDQLSGLSVLVLMVRNGLLVWLGLRAARLAARGVRTRDAGPGPPVDGAGDGAGGPRAVEGRRSAPGT